MNEMSKTREEMIEWSDDDAYDVTGLGLRHKLLLY